jgi:hypothetical protein
VDDDVVNPASGAGRDAVEEECERVERVTEATDELVDAFARLVPQLRGATPSARELDPDDDVRRVVLPRDFLYLRSLDIRRSFNTRPPVWQVGQ